MRNRIKNYIKGGSMEEDIKFGITDLDKMLENCDGYMLCISVLKDDRITPYFLTKNYPKLDMMKQMKKFRDMALEKLEEEE